jgi:solute carrier family 13 (sodium-dependent dicarboxylate transporter), member 2/3/5
MEAATTIRINPAPPWAPGSDRGTPRPDRTPRGSARRWLLAAVCTVLLGVLIGTSTPGLPGAGKITLLVFALTAAAWVFTRLDDTFVALAGALLLVLLGVLTGDELFGALGGETIWLLIAAFVLAAGVGATGLPARVAVALVARARGVRQLAHLVTVALMLTAFAVPATSGRAALALPVFLALAKGLSDRPRVVRALSLLFPTVILLSAVATLIGAGAHLITSHLLLTATGTGIGFGQWLLLGLPLAVVSSHLAAELVLLLFTRREDRARPLWIDVGQLRRLTNAPESRGLEPAEKRALAVLALASVAWITESWHGFPAALVALAAALLITSPKVGTTRLNSALSGVPWSLLMFMAATAALGMALTGSGAAGWLAGKLGGFGGSSTAFLAAVIVVSTAAHLAVQSRSARSSVLVPVVIPLAVAFGLNPAAVAFASTAAAGFCHTLPSSAKPVAIFATAGVPTFTPPDLLRLSAFLAPLTAGLVFGFATVVWPHLGLPLH